MLSLQNQNSQSGQATVEYVLLLAIAVALILGLANQLIKPFGNWAQDYMGQYLECLIDLGELPSVGGGSASGECNSKFSSFSVMGGRPPLDPNRNSNGPRGEDPNRERDSQAKTQNRDGDRSNGGSGASDSGGASRRAASKGFPVGERTGADGPSKGQNGNEIIEKMPDSKFYKNRSSGGNSTTFSASTSSNSDDSYMTPMQKARSRKATQAASTKVKIEESEEGFTKGKKMLVKQSERKIAAVQEDEPWSFSHYIKYVVILAIIIAIVLFIGGQVMQISKSMEK